MLQRIWDKHGLGKIESMSEPSGGRVNRCFIINDAYVIRFDVLDDFGGINRYAGEKWAYDTLRDSDVPVPEVIALDASKTLAPYDYLILTKMPGKMVNASRNDLTVEAQLKIAYSAGEFLATIHNYPLHGFGLLFHIAAGKESNWAAFVADFYQDYSGQVRQTGLLPEEILTRIDAVREKMQPLLVFDEPGRLVHGDYHFSNVLQHDGQLTGILDFEWAMSGDVAWDFRIDDQLEIGCPGSRDAFYAGYTSRRPLTEQHAERVAFYKLGLYLDYLTFEDEAENEQTITMLLKELKWLEANLS